jgi:hypothetical protein
LTRLWRDQKSAQTAGSGSPAGFYMRDLKKAKALAK